MDDCELDYNVIDLEKVNLRLVALEKSFIDGQTTLYFEPHSERWYITREQAANIAKLLIDFICATAPGDADHGA